MPLRASETLMRAPELPSDLSIRFEPPAYGAERKPAEGERDGRPPGFECPTGLEGGR